MDVSTNVTPNASLALVGCGYWGANLARNFLQLGCLATLCDSSETTLRRYGPEYSGVVKTNVYADVLADPKITKIVIAAPASAHYRLCREALLAGKDVMVEKPLCLDVREGNELLNLARSAGRILMVGHLLQYHPVVERLAELVGRGELGRLQYVTSNRLNLGKIRQEENALWSFAPHDISVILRLAGSRLPTDVTCFGGAYLRPNVPDTTLTSMSFGDGVKAHIFVSWLNPFKEQKLTVVGSDGMAVFDDTKPWAQKLIIYRSYLTWRDGMDPTPAKITGEFISLPEEEPLRRECEHFLTCCASRQEPRTSAAEGLRVLSVLQSAQASLDAQGARVIPGRLRETNDSATIHPSATVDKGAVIGARTRVWHYAHVSSGAQIGRDCSLGQNVFVADDVKIGDNVKIQNNVSLYTGTIIESDVFLGPSCVFTNVSNPRSQISRKGLYERTVVQTGASVGANATIVCGTSLGKYCFVAAGAVVTKDVPNYGFVKGVPARLVGWISRHGHPLSKLDANGYYVCPETHFRYEEKEGKLSCIDLNEDDPLPPALRVGHRSYRDVAGG